MARCFLGGLALLEQDTTSLPTLWSRTELKLSGAREHRPPQVFTEPRGAARGNHCPEGMTLAVMVRRARQKAACLHFCAMVSPEVGRKSGFAAPTHVPSNSNQTLRRE